MRSSQAWRSASWHFTVTRKVVLWWDWRTLCFSPRFLSANWEAWAVCSLCSFTPDICGRVMGPELFFRARKALLERAWSSPQGQSWGRVGAKGDVTEEALALPPWELWMPRRCPHLSWSQWSHQTTHSPLPQFTAQNVFHARKIKRSYWKAFYFISRGNELYTTF